MSPTDKSGPGPRLIRLNRASVELSERDHRGREVLVPKAFLFGQELPANVSAVEVARLDMCGALGEPGQTRADLERARQEVIDAYRAGRSNLSEAMGFQVRVQVAQLARQLGVDPDEQAAVRAALAQSSEQDYEAIAFAVLGPDIAGARGYADKVGEAKVEADDGPTLDEIRRSAPAMTIRC